MNIVKICSKSSANVFVNKGCSFSLLIRCVAICGASELLQDTMYLHGLLQARLVSKIPGHGKISSMKDCVIGGTYTVTFSALPQWFSM